MIDGSGLRFAGAEIGGNDSLLRFASCTEACRVAASIYFRNLLWHEGCGAEENFDIFDFQLSDLEMQDNV